jgi:SAM-dependent methyltransferase
LSYKDISIKTSIVSHGYKGGPFDASYYTGNHAGGYTRYADYGSFRSPIIVNRADDLESFELVDGKKVLVIACAFGYFAAELASRGATVTGLDISPYAINQAETLFPSLDFVVEDAVSTSFKNNEFDLVTGNGIVMCMPNGTVLDNLMIEIARILKPNGWFYGVSDLTPQWYYVIGNSELITKFDNWFGSGKATITDTGHLPIAADRRIVVNR